MAASTAGLAGRTPDADRLWQMTMQHSPVGMALVALDGRWLAVNDALCTMLGYDADTLRSRTFQDITHADDLASDLRLLEETVAGKRSSYRLLKRYVHASGHVVWGDLSVALMRDDDGTPVHFISQILDVTAHKESELQLAAAQLEMDRQSRMTEAIFDTIDVGLILIDRLGNYERINRRHQTFMDLAFPDGHAGKAGQLGLVYGLDGVTPLTTEQMPTRRAVAGEEFDDLRIWVGSESIGRMALSVSARSVYDHDGTMIGAALAYKDVTDYVRAIEVKDEFVASVSHELRTPMTSVLGHLEMLTDRPDLPVDVRRQVGVIERNAHRLQHLVSDLLDVAHDAVTGTLSLSLDDVDLAALVRDAVEAAGPTAEAGGVSLVAHLPDTLPLRGDGERLRQVVDNVVSNAVKYTDAEGSVTVTLTLLGDDAELAVADTGVGIAPTDAALIGTRFFRTSQARDRQIAGTGLGLAIVRSLVEAHGGHLTLTSELGVGSTFRVLLPLR